MTGARRGGELGLWTSSALVVGNVIGSGIFLLPASLAPYGTLSLFGWLLTSTGAVLLAVVFARLARRLPKAGGPYAYTRAGFDEFAGFLVGWGYWITLWAGNGGIAVAMISYLGVFLPPLSRPLPGALAAIGAVVLLSAINIAGVRQAGMFQLWTTIIKVTPLLAIALFGLPLLKLEHFTPLNPTEGSAFAGISAAATLTLWAFLGLESATIPADNIREPGRTIPLATVLGTSLSAVIYILGTVAVMGMLPRAELGASGAPFADAAGRLWGEGARRLVAAGAAISCLGALNGWTLLAGHFPVAMARDGLFPERFGRLTRRGTPAFGIVVSSTLVAGLVLLNFTRGLVGLFTFIILLATMCGLFPYVLCALSEIMLLLRERAGGTAAGGPHPWRALRIAAIVPGLAFVYSLWAIAGSGKETVYWGFLLLLTGVPAYVVGQWRRARGEA